MIKLPKGLVVKGLVVGVAMAFPLLAQASVGGAGMLGGRHDFATRSMFMAAQTATAGVGTNQVGLCTYCHTPHQAQTTSLLWNRLPATQSYNWDETLTTGGTTYASIAPTYKGASVKCLACHDGVVSIGDAGVYKQGARTGAATLNTYKVGDSGGKSLLNMIGSGGNMAGNHPIGMPYPLGNAANTYNSITTGSNVTLAEWVATPTVSAPLANGVKLYQDNGGGVITAGTAAGKTGMECSSCHDVHNKSSNDDLMLRGKLNGSTQADGYICLQCHVK